jgi:hypothetical protein
MYRPHEDRSGPTPEFPNGEITHKVDREDYEAH